MTDLPMEVEGDVLPDSWLASLAPGMPVFWTDPDCGVCSGQYTVSEILEDSGRVCWQDTVVRLTNSEGSVVEAYASELSQTQAETLTVTYQVTLTYDVNGAPREALFANLRAIFDRAHAEGLITDATDAELTSFSERIAVVNPAPDEDAIEELLLQRIESGDLALEDIPSKMVSYGLMQPNDFADEMAERLAQG